MRCPVRCPVRCSVQCWVLIPPRGHRASHLVAEAEKMFAVKASWLGQTYAWRRVPLLTPVVMRDCATAGIDPAGLQYRSLDKHAATDVPHG